MISYLLTLSNAIQFTKNLKRIEIHKHPGYLIWIKVSEEYDPFKADVR